MSKTKIRRCEFFVDIKPLPVIIMRRKDKLITDRKKHKKRVENRPVEGLFVLLKIH